MSETTEVWRLRRFALTVGLLLLVWSLAGITVAENPQIAPFGLPLTIAQPQLLPLGLAIAGAYGVLRYFYYAFSFGPSPFRPRRDLLDRMRVRNPTGTGADVVPHTYWGPTDMWGSLSTSDQPPAEDLARDLRGAYPKFSGRKVWAEVATEPGIDQDGDEHVSYAVVARVPTRCRLAAVVQDVDYAAPILFPTLAVGAWIARTFML